jgi:ATP-binding cassette, subfamily C, bacteriocin exporter
LGENGASLSGGQKQRIAIARAIYRKPEVIILDEATSSLDSLSERSVQATIQRLRKAGKTIIIIAHRLSTIMSADKIVVIEEGKVVEQGTHHQLLEKQEAYYKLWASQYLVEEQKNNVSPMDLYTISANGVSPSNNLSTEKIIHHV